MLKIANLWSKVPKPRIQCILTLFTCRTCKLRPIIEFLGFINVILCVMYCNGSQFISSRVENRSIPLIIGFGTFTHGSDHILHKKSDTYYHCIGSLIDKPLKMQHWAIIYKFYKWKGPKYTEFWFLALLTTNWLFWACSWQTYTMIFSL